AWRLAQQVTELRHLWQGREHWETVSARWDEEARGRLAKVPAKDRPRIATAWRRLREGNSLFRLGRHAEAEKALRQALAVLSKVLGERHPQTTNLWGKVASCLDGQGKHTEALPIHRKALAIKQKVLGERHPDTAISYGNMAVCLHAQGKFSAALTPFKKALAIRRAASGERNVDTAVSYNNLATCLESLGNYEEALPRFQKALRIAEQLTG